MRFDGDAEMGFRRTNTISHWCANLLPKHIDTQMWKDKQGCQTTGVNTQHGIKKKGLDYRCYGYISHENLGMQNWRECEINIQIQKISQYTSFQLWEKVSQLLVYCIQYKLIFYYDILLIVNVIILLFAYMNFGLFASLSIYLKLQLA